MDLKTDGEGFLLNREDWTPEVARALASEDGIAMTDTQYDYIVHARKMFDEEGTVPPLRKFIKAVGISKADLFGEFHTGPMKLICKWGGLPKPTGCV